MTREEWLRQEIEGWRKKIALYQMMIAEYEQQLGAPAPVGAASTPEVPKRSGSTVPDDAFGWISGMIFFNKTQPEATKIVLEKVGYPLTTDQLVEALEKGGVKMGGKDAAAKKQNFYTILGRHPDFGRAKPNTWGLVGWPGIPRKSAEESKPPSAINGTEPKDA